MNNWKLNYSVDLNSPHRVVPVLLPGIFVLGDDRAHEWNVAIYENKAAVDLSGYSVVAYVNRFDGKSVLMTGSTSGNVATVTLSEECYAVSGICTGILRIAKAGGEKVTVSAIRFGVGLTTSDEIIDAGDVIPDIDELLAQIDAMEQATAKANEAANAADAVRESIQSSLDELAADIEAVHPKLGITWIDGYLINGTTGSAPTYNGLSASDFVDVSLYAGLSVEIKCRYVSTAGYAFYDANRTYISGENRNTNAELTGDVTHTVDVPENAHYLRITANTERQAEFYVRPTPSVGDVLTELSGVQSETEELADSLERSNQELGNAFASVTSDTVQLTTAIYPKLEITWIEGYLINGTTGSAPAYAGMSASDFIDVSLYTGMPVKIRCRYVSTAGYAFYDANKTYISGENHNTNAELTGDVTHIVDVPESAVYIRISALTGSEAEYYVRPIPSTEDILTELSGLRGEIGDFAGALEDTSQQFNDSLTSIVESIHPKLEITWIDGYLINGTTGSAPAYNGLSASDFMDVSLYAGTPVEIRCRYVSTAGYAFYDADRTYISGENRNTNAELTGDVTHTLQVPENAHYIRISANTERQAEYYVRPTPSAEDILARASEAQNESGELAAIETRIGKNLVPVEEVTKETNGITLTAQSGLYTIEGTASVALNHTILLGSKTAFPDGIEPGETYYVCIDTDEELYIRVTVWDESSTSAGTIILQTRDWTTFTVPANATGLWARLYVPTGATVNKTTVKPVVTKYLSNEQLAELVWPVEPGPMLTIIDDDGHIGFMNDLLPIIEDKHVSIATAITTSRIGSADRWMTWDQILDCYSRGAEVLCHTYNHSPEIPETVEELVWQYTVARNEMFKRGLKDADILVYNNVTGKQANARKAAEMVFKCAVHSAGRQINHIDSLDPYYLQRFPVDLDPDNYDIDRLRALIDQVATEGGWMIWIIHTSAESWTTNSGAQAMADSIDYAIERGVPIVSTECGYRKYVART